MPDAVTPPGNSLQVGWVLPGPGPDEYALENALHDMVCGLTGLPGPMVRPRWQPNPPKTPGADQNWCAFGIVNEGAPGGTAWHQGGATHVEIYERLVVMCSFYGPEARALARALRDGLYVEQNRAMLRDLANLAFVEAGDIVPAPDLVNLRWIRRQDITITLTRGPQQNTNEGLTDIRDIDSAKACGLCGRSR